MWRRRQELRLGRWFLSLPLFRHSQEATALQFLLLGFLMIVLFQALLLILYKR